MTTAPNSRPSNHNAGLGIRLFCTLYDTLLVGGLMICVGLVYGLITDQRQPMQGRLSLQILMVLVVTTYFVGFWSSRRGQTLAMKTWQLKIVTSHGTPLSQGKATQRFILSWLWVAPGAIVLGFSAGPHAPTLETVGLMLGLSMLCYVGLTLLMPDRQYLHDILCRTRLIRTST
jgi:uncharacterized RDD family membrane protein YckC